MRLWQTVTGVKSGDVPMSRFETTHWSVVLRSRGEQADARAALESLCRTYRPPVLAYIRARGHAPDVAEDLAQGFFVSFIERRRTRILAYTEGRRLAEQQIGPAGLSGLRRLLAAP